MVSTDSTAHFTEEGTALERKELAQVSHLGLRGLCFSSHTQSCLRPCSLEGQFRIPACVPLCPSLAPTSRIYHVGTNTAVFPQTPWNPSFPSSPLPSCPSCPQLTLDIALGSGTCRAETWPCPQKPTVFCSRCLSLALATCADKALPLLSQHGANITYRFRP